MPEGVKKKSTASPTTTNEKQTKKKSLAPSPTSEFKIGKTQTEVDVATETDPIPQSEGGSPKSQKRGGKKKKMSVAVRKPPSLEDLTPMENAYFICHDISDFLLYRGFKRR